MQSLFAILNNIDGNIDGGGQTLAVPTATRIAPTKAELSQMHYARTDRLMR
jgi:hypothetical protein